MQVHVALQTEEFRSLGLSEPEARAEALRRFGDGDEFLAYAARQAARRARAHRMGEWFTDWRNDLRFALRLFQKHALLTSVIVFTLALGIGANTAIFSVVHRLLIRPLPYPDGDRIVMLSMEGRDRGFSRPTAAAVSAWRINAHSLTMVAGVSVNYIMVQDPTERDSVSASITSNYLRLLGIAPVIGRDFTPDDERPGSPGVAMISYGLWQRAYGGRPDVLGKPIVVSKRTDNPHIIVAVAPPTIGLPISFNPPGSKWREATPSIWIPGRLDSLEDLYAYAKLRPGVSANEASKELQSILDSAPPRSDGPRAAAAASQCCARALRPQDMLDPHQTRTIAILFVAVAVLLLIACANVANLLMARAWVRRRESRCVSRSAPDAGDSRVWCSPRVCCSRSPEACWVSLSHGGFCALSSRYARLHWRILKRPR
jgi:hypothetical protein